MPTRVLSCVRKVSETVVHHLRGVIVMKCRQLFIGAALVLCTAAITTQVISQDAGQAPPPGMTPEMMAMMEKCTIAGTPGEHHQALNGRIGKWNGAIKMWMTPDMKEPMPSTCTTESAWVMGNRFVRETVEGNFGGESFLGESVLGYDNIRKKYVSTWIDNMSTGVMVSEGTLDTAAKTLKFTTTMSCPMNNKVVSGRTVEKWTDKDNWVMEMYAPWHETGKEYKTMEIHYTRAK